VFWLGGSPQLSALRPLLEASERIVVATGILNVWQSEPERVASEFAALRERFPERVLLGIGIGHPEATSEYRTPLPAMRAFLDGLDAAPTPVPRDARCIAALGPKMLDLSAERSLGAHTYFVPVAHTRAARAQLDGAALLAPELACVLDHEDESGRARARAYAKLYLGLHNYTQNLLSFGFTDEDIADGCSDRLIDAVVPHGTGDQIAAIAREHLSAGADHVCLQTPGIKGSPARSGRRWHPRWTSAAVLGRSGAGPRARGLPHPPPGPPPESRLTPRGKWHSTWSSTSRTPPGRWRGWRRQSATPE
jgi:probable F420-dependent oxidoreductase